MTMITMTTMSRTKTPATTPDRSAILRVADAGDAGDVVPTQCTSHIPYSLFLIRRSGIIHH